MKLAKYEQETVIRCCAEDKTWDVFTADPRMIAYLKRMGYPLERDRQLASTHLSVKIPFRDLRVLRYGRKKRQSGVSASAASLRRASGDTISPDPPCLPVQGDIARKS